MLQKKNRNRNPGSPETSPRAGSSQNASTDLEDAAQPGHHKAAPGHQLPQRRHQPPPALLPMQGGLGITQPLLRRLQHPKRGHQCLRPHGGAAPGSSRRPVRLLQCCCRLGRPPPQPLNAAPAGRQALLLLPGLLPLPQPGIQGKRLLLALLLQLVQPVLQRQQGDNALLDG